MSSSLFLYSVRCGSFVASVNRSLWGRGKKREGQHREISEMVEKEVEEKGGY